MAARWFHRSLTAAGLWALSTTGAWALTLQIVGGGLTAENLNYGCPAGSAPCSSFKDFTLTTGGATATGTIDISVGNVATISLFVNSVSFTPTVPGSPFTFTSTTYTATIGVSTTATPAAFGSGVGYVTGFANGTPFAAAPNMSLNCSYPGGVGQCGLSVGTVGFTSIEGHDWRQQFNVTVQAIPEPGLTLLAALGIAGLVLRARGCRGA